ncbi:uncharacterized protein LOC123319156 [Coccinella septempunctata]|uniref:uncharacterized protein LOC123319156 n=1 Tax=Coccinella septempunctata TaxID=41139 RepID=UPI001D05EC43|nr:uncharacterized protein LOC123319156 [Coccinella septempunctata]
MAVRGMRTGWDSVSSEGGASRVRPCPEASQHLVLPDPLLKSKNAQGPRMRGKTGRESDRSSIRRALKASRRFPLPGNVATIMSPLISQPPLRESTSLLSTRCAAVLKSAKGSLARSVQAALPRFRWFKGE